MKTLLNNYFYLILLDWHSINTNKRAKIRATKRANDKNITNANKNKKANNTNIVNINKDTRADNKNIADINITIGSTNTNTDITDVN